MGKIENVPQTQYIQPQLDILGNSHKAKATTPINGQDSKVIDPSIQSLVNAYESSGISETLQLSPSTQAPKHHVQHAIDTTFKMVGHVTNRITNYLKDLDNNSAKIEFLETFKQHLNAAGDSIDWETDSEKAALVEKAKQHGVVFPEGGMTWNKDQIQALVKNTDGRINPLMSQNDQNKTMLGYFKQKESELYSMLSNILKMDHETIMQNLRSWG
jgi:hypothetical protein